MALDGGSYVKEWSAATRTTITGEPPNTDSPTETARSELRRHDVRFITPYYKTRLPDNNNVSSGLSMQEKSETRPLDAPADYKVEKEDESYKLRLIDPKHEHRRPEAYDSHTLPADIRKLKKATDFPSSHSHRSFVKLGPLEKPQRQRLRSLEVRPITPYDYLSESLERHRTMSLSPLRSKLKVDEKSVNEAWHRLPRPERREGRPSKIDKELPPRASHPKDMSEMALIREKLLERAKNRSTVNINEVSKVQAELLPIPPSTKSQSQMNLSGWETSGTFSPRSTVSINGHADNRGLLRIRTDLSPAASRICRTNASVQTFDQTPMVPLQAVLLPISAASSLTKEWNRNYCAMHERDEKFSSADTEETTSRHGTLVQIKDEHAKKPKSIMKQKMDDKLEGSSRSRKDKEGGEITETIEKTEETTTTEEIERRVRGRSKKDRSERHHESRGTYDGYNSKSRPAYYQSSSQPVVKESYHREVKTKRVHDNQSNGTSYRPMDYRRRDEYMTGDDQQRGSQFQKSYSSRNVFHNEYADDFNNHSYPIVEFPPTLPREREMGGRHVQKTRSLLDWEEQRRRKQHWDDGMSRLERDFRDSLLMPVPPFGGNLKEYEHRENALPGGYESFKREVRAQSGTRPAESGRSSGVTHFKESKQEMQYKKETTADRF